jgi:hypothetical protein
MRDHEIDEISRSVDDQMLGGEHRARWRDMSVETETLAFRQEKPGLRQC